MKDHPRVVWMDSSIRFINTGNFNIVGNNEGSPLSGVGWMLQSGLLTLETLTL